MPVASRIFELRRLSSRLCESRGALASAPCRRSGGLPLSREPLQLGLDTQIPLGSLVEVGEPGRGIESRPAGLECAWASETASHLGTGQAEGAGSNRGPATPFVCSCSPLPGSVGSE